MRITYVTESHAWGDDKKSQNVVTHDEVQSMRLLERLAEIERLLGEHDGRHQEHGRNIGSLWDRVGRGDACSSKIANRVDHLEGRLNAAPQILRDILEEILKESLADKLDCMAKLVQQMREERRAVSGQLEEVRRQREDLARNLEEMRSACAQANARADALERQLSDAQGMKDEVIAQVASFRRFALVPRWFARFLFRQPGHDEKKER